MKLSVQSSGSCVARCLAATVVLGVTVLFGCTEPPVSEATTVTVTDPTGDTFGTVGGVQWDLTAMTVARDTGGVTLSLDFSTDAVSSVGGNTSGIVGFIDLDVDQDTTTGIGSFVDKNRPKTVAGSTGLNADFVLLLGNYAADSTVTMYDNFGFAVGQVRPVFAGHRITFRFPTALLGGDDGRLNAAVIVGTSSKASDIIPDVGHLTLGTKSTSGSAVLRSRLARSVWTAVDRPLW